MRPEVDLRALSVLVLAVLAACSSNDGSPVTRPPPWPSPAPVSLDAELRATAAELELPAPPVAGVQKADEPIADAPLVRAVEGGAAGLTYVEVVLGDAGMDDELPMVLMLHGRGDRPKIPGGPFGCVTTPLRIIMPRAPYPHAGGYTWLALRVADGQTDALAREIVETADRLALLLKELVSERPTAGRPVVTGFSQGGLLTFALAVRYPDLVASAFPLAGWLPPPLWPPTADGLPVIRSLHGAIDETIPPGPTREAVEYLHGLGAQIEFVEFEDTGHRMSPSMNLQFEQWLDAALQEQAPMLARHRRDTVVELGDVDAGACQTG